MQMYHFLWFPGFLKNQLLPNPGGSLIASAALLLE